jgi:hypothetical protein
MNRLRRIIADGWIHKTVWFILPNILALIVIGLHFKSFLMATEYSSWSWLLGIAILVLLPSTLMAISIGIIGPFLISFVYFGIGRLNGGPFVVGDRVRVLSSKYKGLETVVYSQWQGNSVRIMLGEDEKETISDVFSEIELQRIG